MEKLCSLCGTSANPTLVNRRDYDYGVPYTLEYWACSGCGLVFADPIPVSLIPDFYRCYSTHLLEDGHDGNGIFWRIVEALAPSVDRNGAFEKFDIAKDARVLDFGCGSGRFIVQLMSSSYCNVAGCDFDPKVAAISIPGLRFFQGIDSLVNERFDVITLNYVIEHLPDPVGTLRQLVGHLAEGGFIYIRTPNVMSSLARRFGDHWRGWDTPRHLHLFTLAALRLAAGAAALGLRELVTSNDMRAGMFTGSVANLVSSRLVRRAIIAFSYVPTAWALHHTLSQNWQSGEEIVALMEPQ